MEPVSHETTDPSPSRRKRRWLKPLLHVAILAVTLLFVGRTVRDAATDLRNESFHLRARWLAASLLSYGVGLTLLGIPWWIVLRDQGEEIPARSALRVYLISHVGKYVPGKAMVLVIRCGLLKERGTSVGRTTLTSFYETFGTMATGSAAAFGCLLLLPSPLDYARSLADSATVAAGGIVKVVPWMFWGSLAALLLGFLFAITPVGFQLFTRVVTLPFKEAKQHARRRVSWSAFSKAFVAGLAAWCVLGASYWMTIRSVSNVAATAEAWQMATATVALSIVGGFLSMIPGQAVVREAILMQILAPVTGAGTALAASLLYRAVTLGTEVGLGLILYLGGRR